MSLDRRTFLSGALGAATLASAALPGVARASTDEHQRIHATVDALRERWATQRQDYLDAMFHDRASAEASALTPHALALGEGLGALSTFKDLEQIPVEDQMHPAHQRLILDVAQGVGGMLISCRVLLEHFLAGSDGDPHRETHLRGALRSVRLGLAEWPTTGGRQRALEHSLLEIEREEVPGALLRRVEHQVARLKRAEALADQLEARWESSGVLEIGDPTLLGRVRAGQARWADVTASVATADDGTTPTRGLVDPETRAKGVHQMVLGIVVLGVGVGVGAVCVIVGACALACSGGAGPVLLMLAGLSVIGLAVWGGVTLIVHGVHRMKGQTAARDALLGPKMPTAVHPVAVVAEEQWVTTPARRGAEQILVVEAVGLVRSPSGWMADPDGNGTIAGDAALVPGAPVCALVGRVGADVFYLGSLGQVPPGPEGPLELAVNRDLGGPARPKGHFAVQVTVMEPASVG